MATALNSHSKASDDAEPNFCHICETQGKDNEAEFYCQNCLHLMCTSCFKHHALYRQTKYHKIVSGNDVPSSNVITLLSPALLCSVHDKAYSHFCSDHKEACCADCVFKTHLRCENLQELTVAAAGFRKTREYQDTTAELQNLVSQYELTTSKVRQGVILHEERKQKIENGLKNIKRKLEDSLKLKGDQIRKCDKILSTLKAKQVPVQLASEVNSDEVSFLVLRQMEPIQDETDTLACIKQRLSKIDHETDDAWSTLLKLLSDNTGDLGQRVSVSTNQSKDVSTQQAGNIIKQSIHEYPDGVTETQTASAPRNITQKASPSLPKAILKGAYSTKCQITDIVTTKHGCYLLVDNANNCLKMFRSDFEFGSNLKFTSAPWGITMVDSNEAAVTFPNQSHIQFVTVSEKISECKRVKTKQGYTGIASFSEQLFVARTSTMEVDVLDLSGLVLRTISECFLGMGIHGYNFCPRYLALNGDGSRLYVTDWNTHRMLCIGPKDDVQFSNKDVRDPRGLCLDSEGNVFVCESNANKLSWMSGNDAHPYCNVIKGLKKPQCVCYCQGNKMRAIAMGDANGSHVKIFKLQ